MSLKKSSLPRTDAEWADLAEKTLSAFEQHRDTTTSADAPLPGTSDFAKTVDHTLLKLDASEDGIIQCCKEAKQYGFKTVCVRSHFVALAASELSGSTSQVCSVICFPEGTQSLEEKVREGTIAVDAGAVELDYVINYPLLKQGSYTSILSELQTLRSSFPSVLIKLILETSQISLLDIVAGSLLAAAAGLDFVKTSTGFMGAGAKVDDVRLMRYVVSREAKGMGVKASGGIRSAADAVKMLRAGATRLGLSGSVAIMEEGQDHSRQTDGPSGDSY